ncbi:hypothetical protein GIB67_015039 [Kingdonia uniflora]|uniref:Uncharacterized protein n=1 Tax=Kingdonia uniflora TaxID=39325 RepID=A0A7J7NV62_9MAGN|nr:hypothetical protein GIB67_015039 [Kingdonia uniflora]
MKTITLKQPEFMPTLHRRYRNFCEPQRRSTSIPIMNSCSPNSQSRKNEKISVEVQKPFIPEHDDPTAPTQSVLQFNKQQQSDQECDDINKI